MSTRSLPPRPSLASVKKQAKQLLRLHRTDPDSVRARIQEHHPPRRNVWRAGGCPARSRPRVRIRELAKAVGTYPGTHRDFRAGRGVAVPGSGLPDLR